MSKKRKGNREDSEPEKIDDNVSQDFSRFNFDKPDLDELERRKKSQLNDLLEDYQAGIIDLDEYNEESNYVINEYEDSVSDYRNIYGESFESPVNDAALTSVPGEIVIPETTSSLVEFPKEEAIEIEPQISINLESSPMADASNTPVIPIEPAVINQSQPVNLPDILEETTKPVNLPDVLEETTKSVIGGQPDEIVKATSTLINENDAYRMLFGEDFVRRSMLNELNSTVENESNLESQLAIESNTINSINKTNETASKLIEKTSLQDKLNLIREEYNFSKSPLDTDSTEEVAQSKIELPEPATPSVPMTQTTASVQESRSIQEIEPVSSQTSEEVSVPAKTVNEVSEKSESSTPAPIKVNTEIDLSSLEQRLARIEYALSFPLEVKIVN